MPSSDYNVSTGALKLKGAGGVTKKKKSKKPKSEKIEQALDRTEDSSTKESSTKDDKPEQDEEAEALEPEKVEASSSARKTEAELRFEEQKRKRLEEKLKKDGSKTHKEKVEELNRYLSKLSEHHDMPRIGPG